MNHLYTAELAIAIQSARTAGKLIEAHQQTKYHVEEKSIDNPVTVADREADAIIKQIILGEFPNDGWLSEETIDSPDRLSKNRCWVVDPLDGTKEFVNKIPEYVVSIALIISGRPVVGVIFNSAKNEMYTATLDGGAKLNGASIHTSNCTDITHARILASRSELARREWDRFKGKFEIVPCGGMAHKMTEVACGRADGSFTLTPKTEWDFAAGDLIIHEAGGFVTQLDGELFRYNKEDPRTNGLMYANRSLFGLLGRVINRG